MKRLNTIIAGFIVLFTMMSCTNYRKLVNGLMDFHNQLELENQHLQEKIKALESLVNEVYHDSQNPYSSTYGYWEDVIMETDAWLDYDEITNGDWDNIVK